MREIIVKTKNIFRKVSYNLMLHTFGFHQLTCLTPFAIFILFYTRPGDLFTGPWENWCMNTAYIM